MSEDHERRIAELERSREKQWELLNETHTMVKVLVDRDARGPELPCKEHKEDIKQRKRELDEIEDRVGKLELAGSRFGGAWDFFKVGVGAAIPVILWVGGRLLGA